MSELVATITSLYPVVDQGQVRDTDNEMSWQGKEGEYKVESKAGCLGQVQIYFSLGKTELGTNTHCKLVPSLHVTNKVKLLIKP